MDEGVGPGVEYTYLWEVTPDVSPTKDDPDCMTWTYHSHINTVRDVNAGLIGILLTCKPGMMDTMQNKYFKQFAMVVNVFDENLSWYIDHNIQTYLQISSQAAETLKEDEGFLESNMMHGFNGRLYGHLEGLDVCVGSHTIWHIIGFGTEIDIHSLSISGQSFLVQQHRVDAVGLNPVDFVTAELEPQTVGLWRLQCSILNHVEDGEVAFLNVTDCGYLNSSASNTGLHKFKRYYIGIDEVDWNYAPSGQNLFDGGDLLQPGSYSEQYFSKGPSRVGGVYRKALFREYTDVTFSTRKDRGPEEEHLGFLGPVLRVETGMVVALTLKNNAASQSFSIHPHGATFVKMWEGALYNDSTSEKDHADDHVDPGEVKTTYWFFTEQMGPGPLDPPCITRLYTSSSRDVARDAYTGLVGPILICRQGALDDNSRQRQVDQEFFLMFSATDENLSWYSDVNFAGLHGDKTSEDFYESNIMHGINGYMYGNLPGLNMCQDDRVAWHMLSVGSERDVHTAYFHGQPLTYLDNRRSSSFILPGYFRSLLMKAENPGQWALVDQTTEQYQAGAKALFNVNNCGLRRDYSINPTHGKNRTYFLQAEEELWDFAPTGSNWISGGNLTNPDAESYIFTTEDGPYIGKRYKKVRYHQYTDATFTTEYERPDSEKYLGIMGPVIMAEAFDVITVVFRNKASLNYSVHAQGLFYTKDSEGSPYAGGPGGVGPGQTVTYKWSVPLDFAPAEGDPACINHAYYSAVDPVKDTNSGLIGPLVICKPGTLDSVSGQRTDVDRFFVLLFKIFDEGQSWYLQDNIDQFGTPASMHDPDFGESNKMHAINGFVYANNPTIEATQNEGIAWHLMTLGNEVDIHSTHWHGNQVLYSLTGQHVGDVIQLFPGVFRTVWMNATRPGKWLLHCHVHDHLSAGMETVYVVDPPVATTVDPFGGGVQNVN
ncbi:hephaestin-like protein isoform X2 [Babylonia areolata]